jgi:threonine dehydratase
VPAESAQTFADGLATRESHEDAIATICRGAARVVEVSKDAIAEAMRAYFDDTHQIAEGAGAAPLAAMLQECAHWANRSIAVVLSGGNIERSRFLGGATPSVV